MGIPGILCSEFVAGRTISSLPAYAVAIKKVIDKNIQLDI
jgi:hypothetical protein